MFCCLMRRCVCTRCKLAAIMSVTIMLQAVAALLDNLSSMQLWVSLPLTGNHATDIAAWRWWDGVRAACKHHMLLGLALHVQPALDCLDALRPDFRCRWIAEPVRCLVLPAQQFVANKRGFPVLVPQVKMLLSDALAVGVQVWLSVPVSAICKRRLMLLARHRNADRRA